MIERKKRPVLTEIEEIESAVIAAGHDGAALVMSYVNEKGEVSARGIWPVVSPKVGGVVWTTQAGNRCFRAVDSLYEGLDENLSTFRTDRVIDLHKMEA